MWNVFFCSSKPYMCLWDNCVLLSHEWIGWWFCRPSVPLQTPSMGPAGVRLVSIMGSPFLITHYCSYSYGKLLTQANENVVQPCADCCAIRSPVVPYKIEKEGLGAYAGHSFCTSQTCYDPWIIFQLLLQVAKTHANAHLNWIFCVTITPVGIS